jgi:hypothetical protein
MRYVHLPAVRSIFKKKESSLSLYPLSKAFSSIYTVECIAERESFEFEGISVGFSLKKLGAQGSAGHVWEACGKWDKCEFARCSSNYYLYLLYSRETSKRKQQTGVIVSSTE